MSKKLICVFLSLVMLLGVCLTACGQKDDDEAKSDTLEEASKSAATLAVYLMSEKPVDDTTEEAIENAINKITKNKLKTKLDLFFYTKDEYYDKLDAAFAKRDEHKANGTLVSSKKDSDTGEDETETNEHGLIEIKYPTLTDYQVDIFYLGGKENYVKYSSAGRLTKIDDEINSSAKDLTTNIPSQFLSNIKTLNKGTYAIPTSKPIDEYTYLLLNKKALEATHRRSETGSTEYTEYTSITCEAVQSLLEDITDPDLGLTSDYYPLYTNLNTDELIISNLKYWGVDDAGELSDAFSVLGGYYSNEDEYLEPNKYARLENLFENERFIEDIKTLKEYDLRKYYEGDKDKDFAVGYVTGGRQLVEEYGDEYEMIPIEYPRITEDELYEDMFGVCSYTSSVSRSMSVLTLLNTDATIRNLLLYGIEGEHYTLVDTEEVNEYGEKIMAVKRLETGELKYMMDVEKTGNTFIAYPLVTESATLKGHGIKQNQDAMTSLDLGFDLDHNEFKVDVDGLKKVKALSAKILEEYNKWSCEGLFKDGEFQEDVFDDEFYKKADAWAKDVSESADVKAHLACQLSDVEHDKDGKAKTEDGEEIRCGSLYCCYHGWLKDNKVVS